MFVVACLMNAVTAEHKDDWTGRCKHVLSADRAIAVGDSFDAFMRMFHGHGHAGTAGLAMEEILSKATTFSANTTIIAVVNALVRIVVP